MQMWRKWEEEKGQNGDVDLFVDCKEGDSIEWIVPLAVTYIGREDAERSGCLFWHCSWIEEYNTIGSAWNITYIERENTKKTEYRNLTYIERENTERIVLFNVARRSKLVKRALCHPAKHNFYICQLFIYLSSFPAQNNNIILIIIALCQPGAQNEMGWAAEGNLWWVQTFQNYPLQGVPKKSIYY